MKTLFNEEWIRDMAVAYKEGSEATKILDNPYWTCYPRDSTPHDESLARHWVDGWADRFKGAAHAAHP